MNMKISVKFLGAAAIVMMAGAPAFADGASNSQTVAPSANAQSVFAKARVEAAAGHNDAARADLLVAVKLDPSNLAIQKLLGDVEYRLQNYRAAEAAYKAVLVRDPANKDVHNRLGGVYAAEDRFNDAVGEFRASLPSSEGFSNLVEAYAEQGRLGDLEAEYQLEISRSQFDPTAHYNYGYVLSREQRYADAIGQFTQAVGLQPHFADAHNALGKAFGDTGRYQDAINEYKLALGLNPKHYMAIMNWGVELIYLGDYQGAIDKINQSIGIKNDFALSYENLGVAYDYLGDFTRAVELYQRSISLDPRVWHAYVDLGAIYMVHGLNNLAEAAFIKGLSVNPRNAELHYLLGYVYQKQKKFDLAKQQYDLAAAEKSADPDINKRLVELENQLKQKR